MTPPRPATLTEQGPAIPATAQHHPHRWQMKRAGLLDVWYYYDTELDFSGGRLVLRGTNGSGKSRALELLLPFLLDGDRRKMDATGSGKVTLLELMKAGAEDRNTRAGYLWLELARTPADNEPDTQTQYLTIGAHLRYSRSAKEVTVHYFTTDLRVGVDLHLLSAARETLPREKLADLIGADRLTTSPAAHRDRVRSTVFALTGDSGAERYHGLLQLLHTLRSPDVGNRIDEGKLPQILSEALPPLADAALAAAGEQLDALSETRAAQTRLEAALGHVNAFLGTYRNYAATALRDSAEQTLAAAREAEKAERTQARWVREQRRLDEEHSTGRTQAEELTETLEELDATISGIKLSPAYKDARELDERQARVQAHADAADQALNSAQRHRTAETRATENTHRTAAAVRTAAEQAAAALTKARAALEDCAGAGTLPAAVEAHIAAPVTVTETIRLHRVGDPTALTRPAIASLTLTPDDLGQARAQVSHVEAAVRERSKHAAAGTERARTLDTQRQAVEAAETAAQAAQERADEAALAEQTRRTEHEQAAHTYLHQWDEWANAEETISAYGRPIALDQTPLDNLQADPAQLLDATTGELSELDQLAAALAETARIPHQKALFDLDAADTTDRATITTLQAEARELHAARDPHPTAPTWMRAHPHPTGDPASDSASDSASDPAGVGVPLWQCVDFAEDLPANDRAGLEGALLASGLLLATLHPDATVRAADGQLLLHATGAPTATSLRQVLRAETDSGLPTDLIEAVLDRIALHTPTSTPDHHEARAHTLWVGLDGSWGAGPLTGRHTPAAARHIGAVARAQARQQRLADIDSTIAELHTAIEGRRTPRATAHAALEQIKQVTATAPRTQSLAEAAARVRDAAALAAVEAGRARTAATAAATQRTAWAQATTRHRSICDELALPHTVNDLETTRHAATEAATACRTLIHRLETLTSQHATHEHAVNAATTATGERLDCETHAAAQWSIWHRHAAELESIRDSIGREAAQATAELRACETQRTQLVAQLNTLRTTIAALATELGAAEVEVRNAEDARVDTHATLVATFDQLRRRLALPGLADAALTTPPPTPSYGADQEPGAGAWVGVLSQVSDITAPAVRTCVDALLAKLHNPSRSVDENALLGPQRTLERDLSGTYDVLAELREGIRLIELSDATGRSSVPAAAATLARTVAEGRDALSERERTVFTEFVLGGVADELRRRLDQAEELIAAMNASLATISTSHGISVKLRWKLVETTDPAIARIKELVATHDLVRAAADNAELTTLLRERVENAFALDESAGYATHLRAALDYRSWHHVDVLILGPAPGQERRINRKARLSQGETRFVSYVTLFAAVDAYLSGLPDPTRALRLILLDDAFAKVDDPTIAELMGLLVRLDLDFAMTGHALWGTYPQVPSLDCYEVRRIEGSAAVTTHVHWDGHHRHLRAAR